MANARFEYRFVIDAFKPDTLPMSRLAEYMADLARLLGEVERVHFVRLEESSTVLVQCVEPDAVSIVEGRLQSIAENKAPVELANAYKALNARLANDHATGSLTIPEGTELIRFPGREQPQPESFGACNQSGTLDGVPIRIGGKDDTVPVHLQDGEIVHVCHADRSMARRLAEHLFEATLRVEGDGRWERDADGGWLLERFKIADFKVLDETPLSDVVNRLHGVEGSGWKKIDNPFEELLKLRPPNETR